MPAGFDGPADARAAKRQRSRCRIATNILGSDSSSRWQSKVAHWRHEPQYAAGVAAAATGGKHAHPSLKAQRSVELLAIGRGATAIAVHTLHDEIATR
jgi:hypothetical protein